MTGKLNKPGRSGTRPSNFRMNWGDSIWPLQQIIFSIIVAGYTCFYFVDSLNWGDGESAFLFFLPVMIASSINIFLGVRRLKLGEEKASRPSLIYNLALLIISLGFSFTFVSYQSMLVAGNLAGQWKKKADPMARILGVVATALTILILATEIYLIVNEMAVK